MMNKIFWLSVIISAFMPFYACHQIHEPQFDKVAFERVFLKCVESIKGPNSLTASGNDVDEAIDMCRWSARQIAEK